MPASNTQTNSQPDGQTVEINDQSPLAVDPQVVRHVVSVILSDAGFQSFDVSVAIVSNETIQRLNREYLQHDYPTDVLSFLLTQDPEQQSMTAEIIVSYEEAMDRCREYGWSAMDELLLYVVHGSLHLVGHKDDTDEARRNMRRRESEYLSRVGVRMAQSEHSPSRSTEAG